jgi:hypothetical protein
MFATSQDQQGIGQVENAINTYSWPSDLKITDMRLAVVCSNYDYPIIRIDTNQGVYGIGEVRDAGHKENALQFKNFLLGQNPCNVDMIFRAIKKFGGAGRQGGGVSGIEIALWDLVGKIYGVPCYQFLGGKYRDKVRIYADTPAPLTGEQIVSLIEEIPRIEYVKEERPPGPKHIAEVHRLVAGRVKTIFGGFGGKFLPDELRRGANGCMPACEIADLLAKVMERWWAGDEAGARELHRRLLPLIIRETQPFMRYILKRRGVFTSTAERAPAGAEALDSDDRREISILLEAVVDNIDSYPFGPE